MCFQETKREHFDAAYIKNFCPAQFDSFEFLPSVGASGGMLVVWKGNKFIGQQSFVNEFTILVEFTSLYSGAQWTLTTVYWPYDHARKPEFLQWLHNIEMLEETDWLLMGDFDLIRNPDDRNRPGDNVQEMLAFNDAISNHGLVELPLKGKMYT